jgi:hypothetical protein
MARRSNTHPSGHSIFTQCVWRPCRCAEEIAREFQRFVLGVVSKEHEPAYSDPVRLRYWVVTVGQLDIALDRLTPCHNQRAEWTGRQSPSK